MLVAALHPQTAGWLFQFVSHGNTTCATSRVDLHALATSSCMLRGGPAHALFTSWVHQGAGSSKRIGD
eukprot:3564014-Pyramimonas_sp.AAC.1